MSSSTLLPWLLFGPLLTMMGAYLLWNLSGWAWASWLSIGALAWVAGLVLLAFVSHWWHYRKR